MLQMCPPLLTDLISLSFELLAVVVLGGLQVVQPLPQLLGLFPDEPNIQWTVSSLIKMSGLDITWNTSHLSTFESAGMFAFTSGCPHWSCRCSGVCTSRPWSSSSFPSRSASCLSSVQPRKSPLVTTAPTKRTKFKWGDKPNYPLQDAAVAGSHAAQGYLLLGFILSLPVGVGVLLPLPLSL